MSTLLSVNNYYYYRGGAETVFLEHNRMFEESGWQVVPFSMQHDKNLPTPWSKYFIDEIEFGSDYSLRERLTMVPRVIYSMQARSRMQNLIDVVKPDLCHAHNVYHHISPSIFSLLRSRGIPTVLTLHDLKIACPAYNMHTADGICERCKGGRLYNVVTHRCIKNSLALSGVIMLEAMLHRLLGSYRDCVNRFVVPSRFYIDKLVEWNFPRNLFTHIPNFVESQRYQPDYTPGDSFVYFGRLADGKGLDTLIRAAAAAGVSLTIVGTGPRQEELQQLALQLKARVTFTGYRSGAQLHDVVRAARAVVLPSEWYENAPMVILEAYALGKPVIGADIGDIPELILDSQTGTTFKSGDIDALVNVLKKYSALSSDDIAQMGRRARSWVETNFSADAYQRRMLNLYAELGVRTPPVAMDAAV